MESAKSPGARGLSGIVIFRDILEQMLKLFYYYVTQYAFGDIRLNFLMGQPVHFCISVFFPIKHFQKTYSLK